MLAPFPPPGLIKRLKVLSVVCHQDTALDCREGELVFVSMRSKPLFMHRHSIDALLPQTLRYALTQVLVEEKPKSHTAWLAAIRASISSG